MMDPQDVPKYPKGLDLSLFRNRRQPVKVPTEMAPTARALLLAFYTWLNGLPAETLADTETWTRERLVEMFMMEAQSGG
jgi:hypothetical protein